MKTNRKIAITSISLAVAVAIATAINSGLGNAAVVAAPRHVSLSLTTEYISLNQLANAADHIVQVKVTSVDQASTETSADLPELKIIGTVQSSLKGDAAAATEIVFYMPGDLSGTVTFEEGIPSAPKVSTTYLVYLNPRFPANPQSTLWVTGMTGIFEVDANAVIHRLGTLSPQLPATFELADAKAALTN